MHEKRFSFFHEPSFMFMYCTLLLQEPNTNEMDIQFVLYSFLVPYSIAETFFYFLIENQLLCQQMVEVPAPPIGDESPIY